LWTHKDIHKGPTKKEETGCALLTALHKRKGSALILPPGERDKNKENLLIDIIITND
jgi:hypothetical protein